MLQTDYIKTSNTFILLSFLSTHIFLTISAGFMALNIICKLMIPKFTSPAQTAPSTSKHLPYNSMRIFHRRLKPKTYRNELLTFSFSKSFFSSRLFLVIANLSFPVPNSITMGHSLAPLFSLSKLCWFYPPKEHV